MSDPYALASSYSWAVATDRVIPKPVASFILLPFRTFLICALLLGSCALLVRARTLHVRPGLLFVRLNFVRIGPGRL